MVLSMKILNMAINDMNLLTREGVVARTKEEEKWRLNTIERKGKT